MPCRVSLLLLIACTGLLILLHCPTASAKGADFTSKVVRVIDGDTIEVVHNGVPVRILLRGIDCPEKGQPYGDTAKQFTSERTSGKLVTVKVKEIDKYGRRAARSEEHTSELQSRSDLVCRLLLEKKKQYLDTH